MRRITLWVLSTISTLVLLFSYHTSTSSTARAGTSIIAPQSTTATGSTATGSTTTGGSASGTTAKAGPDRPPRQPPDRARPPPREPPQPPRPSMARLSRPASATSRSRSPSRTARSPSPSSSRCRGTTRRTSRSTPGPCRPSTAGPSRRRAPTSTWSPGRPTPPRPTCSPCGRPSTGRTCRDHPRIPVRPHTTTGVTPTLGRKAFVEQVMGMPSPFTSARPSRPASTSRPPQRRSSPTSARWTRCSPPGGPTPPAPAPARHRNDRRAAPMARRCHPALPGPRDRTDGLFGLASPPGWTDRLRSDGAGPGLGRRRRQRPPRTVPRSRGRSMPAVTSPSALAVACTTWPRVAGRDRGPPSPWPDRRSRHPHSRRDGHLGAGRSAAPMCWTRAPALPWTGGSVTVVGPDLLWADVWATAAWVDPMPPRRSWPRGTWSITSSASDMLARMVAHRFTQVDVFSAVPLWATPWPSSTTRTTW